MRSHISNFSMTRRIPHKNTRSRRTFSYLPCYAINIVEQSEIIGKGLTFFVFTASMLNWMYYRNYRKKIEENEK